jgi:hypothetical protein
VAELEEDRHAVTISDVFWPVALAVTVYVITAIPYWEANRHAPPGSWFVGQVWHGNDINTYYSFMRQAAAGRWLFTNNMTYLDHAPVFFNLEFLAFGKLMYWLRGATRLTFEVWRMAGALVLLGGFAFLAHVSLRERLQRRIALLMCAFGGGFGWLIVAASKAGLLSGDPATSVTSPALDIIASIHPFSQIMKNPHFSLPHGLWLTMFAFLLLGERDGRARWYWAAGLTAVVEGLCRPYDLITLYGLIPLFILVEMMIARRIDWKRIALRALPMAAAAPLMLYYAYLFSIHPVFRFWASQGGQPPVALHWHLVSYGLAGVLCAVRLARYRAFPLNRPGERLLIIWIVSVLVLFHAHKVLSFMPYTVQLGVPSATPMIVLGAAMMRVPRGPWMGMKSPVIVAAVAAFLAVNGLSNVLVVRRTTADTLASPANYVNRGELIAFSWLNQNAKPDDVVVSNYRIGSLIGHYVDARCVIGHWAMSPHAGELSGKLARFFTGGTSTVVAGVFLRELNARFIFTEVGDGSLGPEYFESIPNVRLVHDQEGVTLYAVDSPEL